MWIKSLGGRQSPERKKRAEASGHYRNGKFQNLVPTRTIIPGRFLSMLFAQIFGREERVPRRHLPVEKRSAKDYVSAPSDHIRSTWLGHSSVLIELEGAKILTDPVWSKRVSPFQWVGPKRFFESPLSLSDLPDVRAVLISHDHYDHLDMDSVMALAKRNLKFLVPLGVGAHLEAWGVSAEKIVEMNWYENHVIENIKITLLPARHFSGRRLVDADQTFWGSFVIESPKFKIFYSGDTGPLQKFADIGDEFGPFDLTLMQIGACSKNWPEIHMTPEEAVTAHIALKGKLLIPVHWGTFNLAAHAWNDPPKWLEAAAKPTAVRYHIPKPGEIVVSGTNLVRDEWW